MIPLRLYIKNFLCYGDGLDPLDLEGIHVACLCGDNGHGKSALLDAMTWALWGEARAHRQEDLIHQGQAEMQVDLEFLAGEQRYRVIRRHSRSARGRQGVTDLQLLMASNGDFRPITEDSIRQTEEKIHRLLRMDYTTFTNTAFLLQGRADKFTTSPPAERKRLLAEVLGLERYEQAAERARERARGLEQEERKLQGEIEVLAQQAQLLPDYQRELEQARRELGELTPLLEARHHRVTALEEMVQRLRLQEDELAQVREALARALQEQQQLEEQASRQATRLGRLQALLEQRKEIEEGYRHWQRLRDEEEALERAQQQATALNQQRNALERAVEQDRERLRGQATHLSERLEGELEPRAERIPILERELGVTQGQETALGEMGALVQERRGVLEEVSARTQEVATLQRLLRDETEQMKARAALLSQADAVCPLCKTPLGPENRHHLEEELRQQETQAQEQQRAYGEELQALDQRRQGLRQEVEQREEELGLRRRRHQATLTRMEGELAEARKADREAEETRQELATLEGRLARGEYAAEEQAQLQQVEARLESLAYAPAHHQEVRQRARALEEQYQAPYVQLQEAAASVEEESRALEATRQMIQRRATDAAERQQRQAALQESFQELPQQESALAQAREECSALEARHRLVEETVQRCQWEVERLDGVVQQRGERERQLLALQRQRGIYEELDLAFGKNGIQAYIIDEALPELEQEATALLARLTDNRMHLKLETQRQRRTTQGDPIETLDIHIADELGTRSYEMFSGGEAFRVNFALRIALSKLLAHRAGAPLPTLFIDEGFGTQDAAGRERLVEVINSIQEDFQRIIVITHIEELKELFPIRIEVQKVGASSTFWIS